MTMRTLNYLRDKLKQHESICDHCVGKGKNCETSCHNGKTCIRLMAEIRKGFATVEEDESAE